jgi:hypothetical protein
MIKQPHPLEFLALLKWIDGRPLLDVIEPYRQRAFTEALYTFDGARPRYNFVLAGRGKKNWKSADGILAAFYRFVAWESAHGNDCLLLANDEGQAADDLDIAKKLIAANPLLRDALEVKQKEIIRRDGAGALQILPKNDAIGAHGKTKLFIFFDEIHGYKDHAIFEALALDPTRPDAMWWISSYASLYHSKGYPLFDFFEQGKAGTDPRMYFSWYSATFGTDPEFNSLPTAEERANPSMRSWGNDGYLAQQKERLPSNRYRRLHLNLPLTLDGQYFDAEKLDAVIVPGRRQIAPVTELHGGRLRYSAFVDMSGGSRDDAVLSIAYRDPLDKKVRQCVLTSQSGGKPFNPRKAIEKFAAILKHYGCGSVHGDQYAGNTFVSDFAEHGIAYCASEFTRSELYEMVEPLVNAGIVELLDIDQMREQFLGLVQKGERIDHVPGEHDDWCNATAGASVLAGRRGTNAEPTEIVRSPLLDGIAGHNVVSGEPFTSIFDEYERRAANRWRELDDF